MNNNKRTRKVLTEKRNLRDSVEYILQNRINEWQLIRIHHEPINFIIMHPETYIDLYREFSINSIYMWKNPHFSDNISYRGIKVLRSVDIERGEFILI
jgi:hypothetical protein